MFISCRNQSHQCNVTSDEVLFCSRYGDLAHPSIKLMTYFVAFVFDGDMDGKGDMVGALLGCVNALVSLLTLRVIHYAPC